jgi:hypothetical protein
VMLSRAAAADMYPPERRAKGIALVLFGAAFGAILEGVMNFGSETIVSRHVYSKTIPKRRFR